MGRNKSHHPKKIKITQDNEEEEKDRISQLPDAILHHILSLISLMCAMRTTILSNRWRELCNSMWAYTTTLDFGRDFEIGRPLSHVAVVINRLLEIHRGNIIETFRLYFNPVELFHPDIQHWIGFAAEKRVKNLHLDFKRDIVFSFETFRDLILKPYELPSRLFSCDSLTALKLSGCKLDVPLHFRGFSSLKTVHFSAVHITTRALNAMLLTCPALEELTMMACHGLEHSFELSAAELNIKSFTLICCHRWDILGEFISKLSRLRFLSVCHAMIDSFDVLAYQNATGNLAVTLPNLIELQLTVHIHQSIARIRSVLTNWSFPYLEKLTLEWVRYNFSRQNRMVQALVTRSRCVFHRLKTIKICWFLGNDDQMEMVKFLLEKAVVLETMVLLTPKQGAMENTVPTLRSLHEQLLLLPKVSPNVMFVLHEHEEDNIEFW